MAESKELKIAENLNGVICRECSPRTFARLQNEPNCIEELSSQVRAAQIAQLNEAVASTQPNDAAASTQFDNAAASTQLDGAFAEDINFEDDGYALIDEPLEVQNLVEGDLVGDLDGDLVDGDDNKKTIWLEAPIKQLLSLYVELSAKVGKSPKIKSKKKMWEIIQAKLADNGYKFTLTQIEQKFRALESKYKKAKVHNNKTGNNKMIIPFERELDEMFADKPNVFPGYVFNNKKGTASLNRKNVDDTEASSSSNLGTSNVCRDHTDCPKNAFCEKTPNLKNGQCVCPTGYIIITNDGERECYKTVATVDNSCKFHEQCMITLSTESECKWGKCQCRNGTHFVERANSCYKSVRVGEICTFTNNCLGEGVVCNAGYCTCPFGKHPNFDSTDCVQNIHLGEKCLHDQECLPTNSRCQEICICRNGFSKSSNNETCLKVSNHVYDVCLEDSQCTEILPHTKCDRNHKLCVCNFGYHEIKYRCWVTVPLGGVCEADENCATIEHSKCRNDRCFCDENFKELNGLCSSSQILLIYQRIFALAIIINLLIFT